MASDMRQIQYCAAHDEHFVARCEKCYPSAPVKPIAPATRPSWKYIPTPEGAGDPLALAVFDGKLVVAFTNGVYFCTEEAWEEIKCVP